MTKTRWAGRCKRLENGPLRAGLASVADEQSPVADAVRQEFASHFAQAPPPADVGDSIAVNHADLHWRAVAAARQAVLTMRATDEIGDDAFHQIEEELDWLEMAGHTSR